MSWLSNLASLSMAVGPPLVYLDQAISIVRRKNAAGFSKDICGVLIMANITRIYFWVGNRFEVALLFQSIFMFLSQIALLHLCLKYSNISTSSDKRWIGLWRWNELGSYIDCIAVVVVIEGVLFLLLQRMSVFIEALGLLALGLESTLPIPQLVTNWKRKSLQGFRYSVLAGWLFGDSFKLIYFFVQPNNSWQFKLCAAFQLSVDFMIVAQSFLYRRNTFAVDDTAVDMDAEDNIQEVQR